MTTCPWNIYQTQLFHLGYGLPLWHPEPSSYEDQEPDVPIEIGTVGWMSNNGGFRPVFNCMKPEDDTVNRRGVPRDFKKLDGVYIGGEDDIHQAVLSSHSVDAVEVRVEAGTRYAGGRFSCS